MKKRFFILVLLVLTMFLVGCKKSDTPNPGSTGSDPTDRPTRPHNHDLTDITINKMATLFEKGQRTLKCSMCEHSKAEDYYYLDEVSFTNKTYQYTGQIQKIEIDGLLPVGITVKYQNNTRKEVGTTVATANFVDSNENIVASKEATLTITSKKGLPNLNINTNNAPIDSKENYTVSTISVTNCESEYAMENVQAGVRLRGNGTLEASKKPYRIKFDKKQSILGLNDGLKAKSWVLLAEFYDYSFMRNATAFMIGDALFNYNENYYASDFEYVNVYVNGIYGGVYVLCEQSQVNSGRVDIYEPDTDETNLNVGYLVELDQYAINEGDCFSVGNQEKYNLKSDYYSLKSDYYAIEQKNYIEKYMNSVLEVLYNAAMTNIYYELDEKFNVIPSTAKTDFEAVNKVMDVDSFIRSFILEEIIKDIDVGFSSYYLYVDFSEGSKINRLTTSVPWDFDWSSGNASGTYQTNGDYNSTIFDHMNIWLYLISKCDFFESMITKYYQQFRTSGVMEKIYDYQDYIATNFKDEFDRNFMKWQTLGTSQHQYHSQDVLQIHSHQDAKNKLQTWLKNRIAYLDGRYLK